MENNEEDSICIFCMKFPIEPVIINCGHRFCNYCLEEYSDYGKTDCPLCKEPFEQSDLVTDIETAEKLKKRYQKEYDKRLKEINKINKQKIEVVCGNRHELVNGEYNNHMWTCFVTFKPEDLKKIRYVRFLLDPTFEQQEVVVFNSPFELTRVGWGEFVVDMIVVFRMKEKLKNIELSQSLSFQDGGKWRKIKVAIEKK